ncbi:MAG: hypothetical protein LBT13_09425 [Treponema sp.]|nr:hypothetical protein [Treponema sp.]
MICLWLLVTPCITAQTEAAQGEWPLLIGTRDGLYSLDRNGTLSLRWSGGAVRKIIRSGDYWALLSDQGILVSTDLIHWEARNEGLPVKTIKVYEKGKKSFIYMVQELKDLEIHPGNPDLMVCAIKDAVFLSRDKGRGWVNLGMPAYRTNGIKAVAVANLPELTVFLSHSLYGIHYINADIPGAKWLELNTGIENLETTGNPDEVSDIAVVLPQTADGQPGETVMPIIYAAQTFRQRVYQLDWKGKRFVTRWSDGGDFGTVDSLDIGKHTIRFVQDGGVVELDRQSPAEEAAVSPQAIPPYPRQRWDLLEFIAGLTENLGLQPTCLFFWADSYNPYSEHINLSELWLLDSADTLRTTVAKGREGLYLPVNHAGDQNALKPYLDLIAQRGLNMVVIDMKDDYGRLRFTPNNPAISAKGRVFRPIELEGFLKNMKERGIYTVARIVVFKDGELAKKEGGKFAVWDSRTNKSWAGYYDRRQKKTDADKNPLVQILPADDPAYEILRTYYDESWVDPYSEEVWDYIAAIAGELHERGFDEIQFDYIRFPTDGVNLPDARYRWRDNGMDMDSALLSFLRHIRSQMDAPISIDIYGANGWYRTGARTGQEVELLAPYVDVICPMYYPSHFEQAFLAQAPAELRPYRIYYQGTQRTERISRDQIVVRPYVQAFYLNVSYDRKYYNLDYVRREVEGVRDAGSPGLTYWNNSGRYDDIPSGNSGS